MNKNNKIKQVAVIGLLAILCSVWASAPLWLNRCVPSRLSEEEIQEVLNQNGFKHMTAEERIKSEQQYRDAEIPCGAQNLSVDEKLGASRFQEMILHEFKYTQSLILKFELVKTGSAGHSYYFKAYTFFYIPFFRAFGGGSGYMEIQPLPFKTDKSSIAEWE